MPSKKKFSHVQKNLFQSKSHVQQKFSIWKKKSPMFNQNLSMSYTKNPYHHQISWIINIVQVILCQIAQQFKSAPRPRLQHDQPYNAKFQQEQITTKWQCLNTKLSIKHEINKFPNKEIQKHKAHLKVHFGLWSMGLRVLEEPFFLILFKWWVIFFPTKVRKDGLLEYAIINAKNGGLEMGFKKWVCSKSGQEYKDLKKGWGRWMKASWEAWESNFLEKK